MFSFLSFLFCLSIFFTGCTNKVHIVSKVPSQHNYKSLVFQGKNHFPSTPRKVLIKDNIVYISFDNGEVISWNKVTQKYIQSLKRKTNISNRALLISNKKLYIGSNDMYLYSIELQTQKQQQENYYKGSIFDIKEYSDYLLLALGNASIGVIQKTNLKPLYFYRQHHYLIYTLCINKTSNLLYSGSDDNTIVRWKISNQNLKLIKPKIVARFKSAVRNIKKIQNLYIVTTSLGNIYIYDKSFKKIFDQKKQNSNIITLLIDNNIVYTGNVNGEMYIYKLNNNKNLSFIKKYQFNDIVRNIVKKDINTIFVLTKNGEALTIPSF